MNNHCKVSPLGAVLIAAGVGTATVRKPEGPDVRSLQKLAAHGLVRRPHEGKLRVAEKAAPAASDSGVGQTLSFMLGLGGISAGAALIGKIFA